MSGGICPGLFVLEPSETTYLVWVDTGPDRVTTRLSWVKKDGFPGYSV